MATPNLDFSVVANNAVSLTMTILDSSGNGVNGTGMSIKWQWFLPNMTVTKSTALGTIVVNTANPLVITIPILASDTLGGVEGSYAHEAITVDASGNPVTVTENDAKLTWGVGWLRRQLTVQ